LDEPEFTRLVEFESGMFHLLTDGFVVDVFQWLSFFPFKSIQTLKDMCHERDEIGGRICRSGGQQSTKSSRSHGRSVEGKEGG